MTSSERDALLTEQLEYYRARADEYDQWWFREERFDRGHEADAQWFAEVAELERVLKRFAPVGRVLELACGTGLWTRHLANYADAVTAVDAAPEVLAINRARVAGDRVTYLEADLFDYTPEPASYDVCFFSFWLSHVPEERFARFWGTVGSALAPGGRVLFIDSARDERSTAADHRLPDEGDELQTRRLDDGREFQIVKRFYNPAALSATLADLGWDAEIETTGEFFIYATATPAAGRP